MSPNLDPIISGTVNLPEALALPAIFVSARTPSIPPIGSRNPAAPISNAFPALPKTDPVPIQVAAIVPTKIHGGRDLPATAKSSWFLIESDLLIPIKSKPIR